MIVDSSALLAILRGEPGARACAQAIAEAASRRISAANFLETAMVIDGSRDPVASRRFDDLVRKAQLVIEPVTEAQAKVAREAYRDFGKGSGHPAKLNFGDCFAYALAKTVGEPLLFKGGQLHAHRYCGGPLRKPVSAGHRPIVPSRVRAADRVLGRPAHAPRRAGAISQGLISRNSGDSPKGRSGSCRRIWRES